MSTTPSRPSKKRTRRRKLGNASTLATRQGMTGRTADAMAVAGSSSATGCDCIGPNPPSVQREAASRPFQHERHRSAWQAALYNFKGPNVDDRLVLRVERMEMRRRMITPKHLDQNAVKRAHGRHHRHIARMRALRSTLAPPATGRLGSRSAAGHVWRSKCFRSGGGRNRVRLANTLRSPYFGWPWT